MSEAANRIIVCVLATLLLASCAQQPSTSTTDNIAAVSIMTFNVENLFDTLDDPGKDDSTYLPLKHKQTVAHRDRCSELQVERWRDQCLNYDWSTIALEIKMSAVARAALQFNGGRGPDILVLQEIENANVLEQLRVGFLSSAGYRPAVLIEGNDKRGIDVAFLSRFDLAGDAVLHAVAHAGWEQSRIDDTRGILEATFRLPDGTLLTGYAVHFPAPYHPREMREQAYEALNLLHDALPPGRMAFAAGDFNTTAAENAEHKMLDRWVRPKWIVAHDACSGCPGTYFYPPNNTWSFLDTILWSRAGRGEKTTWRMRAGSVQLVNRAAGQTTADSKPRRFELPDGTGISDHWPLAMTIESVPKQ